MATLDAGVTVTRPIGSLNLPPMGPFVTGSIDTAAITAAAAFGAAIAGAATGGLATYMLDRRQEEKQARGGARLVRIDLADAARQLHKVVKDHSYTSVPAPSMGSWEEHRAVIATHVSAETWTLVAGVVDDITGMSSAFEGQLGASVRRVLRDPQLEAVRQLRDRVLAAHLSLAVLAEEPAELTAANLDESIERAAAVGAPQ